MQLRFRKSFEKDIDKVVDKETKSKIIALIKELETAPDLTQIPQIKKLKGHVSAYRIRIGSFRFCFYQEPGYLDIVRFLDRKDVYRYFPK